MVPLASFAHAASAVGVNGMRATRTIPAHLALQVPDLGLGRVLAAGAQQVAEGVEVHAPGAALVEEGEGLLEVGALRLLAHRVISLALRAMAVSLWWWSSKVRGVGGVGVAGADAGSGEGESRQMECSVVLRARRSPPRSPFVDTP